MHRTRAETTESRLSNRKKALGRVGNALFNACIAANRAQPEPCNGREAWRAQPSLGLAGFLDLRDLALTGFFEDAGLMLIGLPTATGVTAASGSGLK